MNERHLFNIGGDEQMIICTQRTKQYQSNYARRVAESRRRSGNQHIFIQSTSNVDRSCPVAAL